MREQGEYNHLMGLLTGNWGLEEDVSVLGWLQYQAWHCHFQAFRMKDSTLYEANIVREIYSEVKGKIKTEPAELAVNTGSLRVKDATLDQMMTVTCQSRGPCPHFSPSLQPL